MGNDTWSHLFENDNAKNKEYERIILKLEIKISELEKYNRDLNQEIEKCKREKVELFNKIDELNKALEEKQKMIDALIGGEEKIDQNYKGCLSDKAKLLNEINRLKLIIEGNNKTIEDITSSKKVIEQAHKNCEEEKKRLRGELISSQGTIDALSSVIQSLKDEIANLKQIIEQKK